MCQFKSCLIYLIRLSMILFLLLLSFISLLGLSHFRLLYRRSAKIRAIMKIIKWMKLKCSWCLEFRFELIYKFVHRVYRNTHTAIYRNHCIGVSFTSSSHSIWKSLVYPMFDRCIHQHCMTSMFIRSSVIIWVLPISASLVCQLYIAFTLSHHSKSFSISFSVVFIFLVVVSCCWLLLWMYEARSIRKY